jgi:hypothetical protein
MVSSISFLRHAARFCRKEVQRHWRPDAHRLNELAKKFDEMEMACEQIENENLNVYRLALAECSDEEQRRVLLGAIAAFG